jgi:hypothetical protein
MARSRQIARQVRGEPDDGLETNSAPVLNGLSGNTSIRLANHPTVCFPAVGVAGGCPHSGCDEHRVAEAEPIRDRPVQLAVRGLRASPPREWVMASKVLSSRGLEELLPTRRACGS